MIDGESVVLMLLATICAAIIGGFVSNSNVTYGNIFELNGPFSLLVISLFSLFAFFVWLFRRDGKKDSAREKKINTENIGILGDDHDIKNDFYGETNYEKAGGDYYLIYIKQTDNIITYQILNDKKQTVIFVECEVNANILCKMTFLSSGGREKLFEASLKANSYIVATGGDEKIGEFYLEGNNVCLFSEKRQEKYLFTMNENEEQAGDILEVVWYTTLLRPMPSAKGRIFHIFKEKKYEEIGKYFTNLRNLCLNDDRNVEIDIREFLPVIVFIDIIDCQSRGEACEDGADCHITDGCKHSCCCN
jgi:hypothetical protein